MRRRRGGDCIAWQGLWLETPFPLLLLHPSSHTIPIFSHILPGSHNQHISPLANISNKIQPVSYLCCIIYVKYMYFSYSQPNWLLILYLSTFLTNYLTFASSIYPLGAFHPSHDTSYMLRRCKIHYRITDTDPSKRMPFHWAALALACSSYSTTLEHSDQTAPSITDATSIMGTFIV